MSLITAFEIITLAGVGLGLFSIAAFEISDAVVDRKYRSNRQLAMAQPARRVVAAKSEVTVVANQFAELPKAA